jgi:hypothetical protein
MNLEYKGTTGTTGATVTKALIILAIYLALVRWVFPRLGVPT